MNKEDLVNMIAAKTRMTKKDTSHILDALTETIMETVASGDKVVLVGFGTFEPRNRKERKGMNPQTGQSITIPATTVPAFSAGKVFKEQVVNPEKTTDLS